MKPTDEELIARLLNLDAHPESAPKQAADRIATLLRACKGRVKVKPLEWRATRFFGDDPVKFEAGPYAVECMSFSGKWKVVTQPADGNVKNGIGGYKTFEAAAAVAQADYEARIIAALEQEPRHE